MSMKGMQSSHSKSTGGNPARETHSHTSQAKLLRHLQRVHIPRHRRNQNHPAPTCHQHLLKDLQRTGCFWQVYMRAMQTKDRGAPIQVCSKSADCTLIKHPCTSHFSLALPDKILLSTGAQSQHVDSMAQAFKALYSRLCRLVDVLIVCGINDLGTRQRDDCGGGIQEADATEGQGTRSVPEAPNGKKHVCHSYTAASSNVDNLRF